MTDVAALLKSAVLIPVLTIERVEDAVPLAEALVAGGVRVLEVTLRTAAAKKAAELMRRHVPDAIVGFGTVLTEEDLRVAKDLDLPFAFSPGATVKLIEAAARVGIAFIPGVGTASELMVALENGINCCKLFPAEQVGGIGMLKSLGAPFPQARFCPTGGITEATAPNYLALPNVLAVGGSWLTPAADIRAGNFAAITERAKASMAKLAS
jgi:2-dehydro-3-deoxyphosphogluconate aldolase/(4S)-4-hydroxy-2-oxoglutarate aldolase